MTMIKSLTTEHLEFGQIIRARARRKHRDRSKRSSNGSMPRKALGLSPWSAGPRHSCTFVSWKQQGTAAYPRAPASRSESARVRRDDQPDAREGQAGRPGGCSRRLPIRRGLQLCTRRHRLIRKTVPRVRTGRGSPADRAKIFADVVDRHTFQTSSIFNLRSLQREDWHHDRAEAQACRLDRGRLDVLPELAPLHRERRRYYRETASRPGC